LHQREFVAVIPGPGEKYAGELCARCLVDGCDRKGNLFHVKNLMTHAAPRGGQPSRVSAAIKHAGALAVLLGYTPALPPLPPPGMGERNGKHKKVKGAGAGGSALGDAPATAAAAAAAAAGLEGVEHSMLIELAAH
jgi:hypothetical protein